MHRMVYCELPIRIEQPPCEWSSPMADSPPKRNGSRARTKSAVLRVEVDIPTALSYDDVLLLPRRTTVSSRRMVDTTTNLTRNITLNIPIVSANMDTVTEHAMAAEMARQGGIGIIHRFLSIEAEADEVRKVKRAESFVISQPYVIAPDQTVEQARL